MLTISGLNRPRRMLSWKPVRATNQDFVSKKYKKKKKQGWQDDSVHKGGCCASLNSIPRAHVEAKGETDSTKLSTHNNNKNLEKK